MELPAVMSACRGADPLSESRIMKTPLALLIGSITGAALLGTGILIGRLGGGPVASSQPESGLMGKPHLPGRFKAKTTFQINLHEDMAATDGYNPLMWLETNGRALTASGNLKQVVERLKLDQKWSLSPEEALARLTRMLETEQLRATFIFSVIAWSDEASEAIAIADAVREVYVAWRISAEKERVRRLTAVLDDQIRKQEKEAEATRETMTALAKKFGIIDTAPLSATGEYTELQPAPGSEAPSLQGTKEYTAAKRQHEASLMLLCSIREHSMKIRVAAGSTGPPIQILVETTATEVP
jgi:hypothetical protein